MVWYNKEWSYFNIGNISTGEFISDKPIKNAANGIFNFEIEKNGKYNFLKNTNNLELVLPQWADSVTDFNENGKAIAVINGEEYILDSNENNFYPKKEGVQ